MTGVMGGIQYPHMAVCAFMLSNSRFSEGDYKTSVTHTDAQAYNMVGQGLVIVQFIENITHEH
jgi:hypothetical protein